MIKHSPSESRNPRRVEFTAMVTRVANAGVQAAQEEHRRKGVPMVFFIHGKPVWEMPDGTLTLENPWPPRANGSSES